jgi:hypothetical protein
LLHFDLTNWSWSQPQRQTKPKEDSKVKKTLFLLMLITLASATLFAQNARKYGVPTYVEKTSHVQGGPTHPYQEPSSLKKIYSNLGPSTDAFYYEDGWLVLGPDSDEGHEQWIGFEVTPTANHTVTQLRAAMFYYSDDGSGNDFNFGIWSNSSSGVPDKEIQGADKKNLPTWTGESGNCCKTQNVTIKSTKIKKGTTYWMVITNASNTTDASGAWDFTYDLDEGTQGYNLGDGWDTEDTYISAFAWYGTK